ncbi:histone-like nucleoid-structuring protein Lsr2 [Nocardia tengchongensis]|uniref:histone-like nucleoid-structuring protein Lsr2 n=1 Tax=Nocardia tengchongensis TaxID=2055889 RepID=UPI003614BA66
MVRKVVVSLIDDIDGNSEAVETISFALDGVVYELDLSAPNATDLRSAFEEWSTHAREVTRAPRAKKNKHQARSEREQNAAIRQWARDNGFDIAPRGRIHSEVATAYRRQNEPAPVQN